MKKSEKIVLDNKSIEAKISHIFSCVLAVMAVLTFGLAADPLAFGNEDWKERDETAQISFIYLFCSSTLWNLGTMVDNSKKQTILLKDYFLKQ